MMNPLNLSQRSTVISPSSSVGSAAHSIFLTTNLLLKLLSKSSKRQKKRSLMTTIWKISVFLKPFLPLLRKVKKIVKMSQHHCKRLQPMLRVIHLQIAVKDWTIQHQRLSKPTVLLSRRKY